MQEADADNCSPCSYWQITALIQSSNSTYKSRPTQPPTLSGTGN